MRSWVRRTAPQPDFKADAGSRGPLRRGNQRLSPLRLSLDPGDDLREFLSRDCLFLEQLGNDGVEGGAVVAEQDACPLLGLGEQPTHFLVDDLLGALGVGALGTEGGSVLWRTVGSVADGAETRGEAPFGHHLDGECRRSGKVAGRAGGGLADDQVLRGSAAQTNG